jgi:calcineurin-like phosphoesterase family protein
MKSLHFTNPDKIYFTSDTHLGHANIMVFCQRPFADVDEMDRVIMENWNKTVSKDDTIFILGDFCWRLGDKEIAYYLNNLNGSKIFIKGNHDMNEKIFVNQGSLLYDGFVNIGVKEPDSKEEQRITLCHYPMLSWYQSHRGAWNLFGHWHSAKINTPTESGENILEANKEVADFVVVEHNQMKYLRATQYDVGVDGNDFTPISYYQIKKIIQNNLEIKK